MYCICFSISIGGGVGTYFYIEKQNETSPIPETPETQVETEEEGVKDVYTRTGYASSVCASNEELDSGLCYPKCETGYTGSGNLCFVQSLTPSDGKISTRNMIPVQPIQSSVSSKSPDSVSSVQPVQKSNSCSSTINGGVCPMTMSGKHCKVITQGDGNLVVYSNGNAVWASNTDNKGTGPYKLVMQADGNLVLYDNSRALWASNTDNKGSGPYRAYMQDDCNFVVYDNTSRPLWASNTNGK